MAVLLLAELNGSDLAQDLTAKTLTAARDLGEVTVSSVSYTHLTLPTIYSV